MAAKRPMLNVKNARLNSFFMGIGLGLDYYYNILIYNGIP
jgi:hypothetical protein